MVVLMLDPTGAVGSLNWEPRSQTSISLLRAHGRTVGKEGASNDKPSSNVEISYGLTGLLYLD